MKLTYLLVFLLLQLNGSAATTPVKNNFVIENNIIKSNGSIVGRIEFDKQEVNQENIKARKHLVKIYNSESNLIAVYSVRSSLKKAKKNMAAIFDASLNTIKDNVTHTGSNFLDFNEKEKNEEAIPQLAKVIGYLCNRDYL